MALRVKLPAVDPFLLWLIGTVVAASLLPARGAALVMFDYAADAAIVLLFFLHGAKLSRETIVAGHLLRQLIGNWIDKQKKLLQAVDRSSILLVVYSAFSAVVVSGVWQRVGPFDLGVLFVASAVILGVVIAVNGMATNLEMLTRHARTLLEDERK